MAGLPSGTVTFLFTDLEGSTRLWEEHPEAMKAVDGCCRITGLGVRSVTPASQGRESRPLRAKTPAPRRARIASSGVVGEGSAIEPHAIPNVREMGPSALPTGHPSTYRQVEPTADRIPVVQTGRLNGLT
jgi:hypothetical protein